MESTAATPERTTESRTAVTAAAIHAPVDSSPSENQSGAAMTNTPASESTVASSSVTTTPINTTVTATSHIVRYSVTPVQTVIPPSSFNAETSATTADTSESGVVSPLAVTTATVTTSTATLTLASDTVTVQGTAVPETIPPTSGTRIRTDILMPESVSPSEVASPTIIATEQRLSPTTSSILVRDVLHRILADTERDLTGVITDILYPDALYSNCNLNSESESEFNLATLELSPNNKTLSLILIPMKSAKAIFFVSEPRSIKCQFCQNKMKVFFFHMSEGNSLLYDDNQNQKIRPCILDNTLKLVHQSCLEERLIINSEGRNYRFTIQVEHLPILEWRRCRDELIRNFIIPILLFIMLSSQCTIIHLFIDYYPSIIDLFAKCLIYILMIALFIGCIWRLICLIKNYIKKWRKLCKNKQKTKLILWKRMQKI